MKRYLFYLIAIICWPLAVFGQMHHLKVEITPHGSQYGSSILILNPDGSMEFVDENEGDIAAGKMVRIYPMSGLEGYTLKEWKENGTPINLETQTSQWGEIYADYTMPNKDVVLTAVFSNGSDNPDPPQPSIHNFKVSADHYGDVGNDVGWGAIGNVLRIKNGKSYVLSIGYTNELSTGDTLHIYAQSENQYWTLKEWKENEAVKQLKFIYDNGTEYEGYYEYVMPDYDVNLVAYFEKTVITYKFKVSADHYGNVGNDTDWGSIGGASHIRNGRSYVLTVGYDNELSEGDTIHVYAQSGNQYWKLKEWKENEVVKKVPFTYDPQHYDGHVYDGYYEYLMPGNDVNLVAYFEPTLASPDNPGANQVVGGIMVLNDFTPGGLSNAIPSDNNSFTSIVVIGDMREKDLSVAHGTNATTLDLTRTYGYHTIPWSAFAGGSSVTMKVEHILLPSCIDNIASSAFERCTSLKQLTILATTPPKLAYNTLNSGVTVKVPETSLALYKAAEEWKNLKIEAITEEVSNLTLMLPNNYTDGRYKNMSIELVNATTGETSKLIVTDNQSYTFRTLVSNTRYTAYLKSSGGNIISLIANIFIDNGDKTLTFANVKMLQDVTLTVMALDSGKDVTSDVEVTWMDASGRYLCKGNMISNIMQGTVLKYSVKLSDELAKYYDIPSVGKYTVNAYDNVARCSLQPIEKGWAKGTVVSKDGLRLENALVKILQTVNGKYTSITETTTDSWGEYSTLVLNVPSTITVGANGYIVKSISRDDFTNYSQTDFFKLEAAGPPSLTLSYSFTYDDNADDGGTSAGNAVFSDLANVDFKVYNSTKKKEVTEFVNSYPQLLFYDEINSGDKLEIIATSRTKSFAPMTIDLTVCSDGQQDIVFPLKRLGGIDASFASTTNPSVVGILYDSKQQFVQMKRYEEALLSFRELADGAYTLITMKEDDRYNKIQSLSQYGELGLTEGDDYVKNDVNVVSGTITTVENEVVPASELGGDSYTNTDATYFAVSETTSSIGHYVTVRSRVEFKDQYADGVTSPKLVVDIPDGCDFVEKSVIMGTKTIPYTYEGCKLSVPLDAGYDLVKFCLLPKTAGNYRLGGNAQFSYGDKVMTEPVGTAVFNIKANENLSFTIPSTIVDSTFYASGIASVAAVVKIYVDGQLNAQTIANANGNWSTKCQLNNPANLSSHQVQAIIETSSGESASSDVKTIVYDQQAIVVENVTMKHYNPEWHKTFEVVFGFNDDPSQSPSYTVYYPKPDFTFSVKLNTVDENRISNMVLSTITMRGDTIALYPVFDPTTGTWVASHTYEPISYNVDPPVNVCLDFDDVSPKASIAIDREMLNQAAKFFSEYQESVRKGLEEVKAINDDYKALLERGNATQEELDAIRKRLEESLSVDFSALEDTQKTNEQLLASVDSLLGDSWQQDLETMMNSYQELKDLSIYGYSGNGITVNHTTGLTEVSLLERGYEKILASDSTYVYLLTTKDEYAFVDFVTDQYIHVDLNAVNPDVARQLRAMMAKRRDAGGLDDPVFWYYQLAIVNDLSDAYDKLCSVFETVGVTVTKMKIANLRALADFNKMDVLSQIANFEKGTFLTLKAQVMKNVDNFFKFMLRPFIKGTARVDVALEKAPFWGQLAAGLFKTGMSLLAMVNDEINAFNQMGEVVKLWNDIPRPCEDDQAAASVLEDRVKNMAAVFGTYHAGTIAVDIGACVSSAASLPIFETPEPVTKGVMVFFDFCALFNSLIVNPQMSKKFEYDFNSCKLELSLLECNKDKKKKDKKKKDTIKKNKSNSPDAKVLIDPSGYVYEGVASNRLEGVMTTIFYRQEVEDVYGDKHDETVLWDAENYDQQNPLYTDKDGHYEWFVPEGLWQVKYEKDGYQTAYSEWLPVPPPQLDVNQAMIQTAQPEVTMAHCYPTGIEVEFSKYMKPSTLNKDNIFLTHAGKKVGGKVIMLNEEEDLKGNKFVSKVRFVADEKIAVGEQVQLTVSHKVKSYADVMMPNDFTQTFTIEHEISEIVTDSVVRVTYGTDKSVIITVTPAEAAKGKTLQVVSGMAMIATTDKAEYVLDENGQAEVTIKGLVPGSTALLFSIKVTGSPLATAGTQEYSASAMTYVEVLDPNQNYVAEPKSSIASGSEVTKGQQITLTCETPGAVIYYTLDGSCPCNDTLSRQIYSGPITITDNVTVITAMAAAKDLGESDIVTFNYHLHGYTGIDELSSSVNIWPLVTRSNVNVDLGGQKARSVSVMNANGVRLFNATNVNEQITIDFTMQPTGLYIIAVQMNNGTIVRKIVKK